MHDNLEKRFVRLAVAQSTFCTAMQAFKARYHLLFSALAEEKGMTIERLAKKVGFDPCPPGGNKVMRGEAEPSTEDVLKLLAIYLEVK